MVYLNDLMWIIVIIFAAIGFFRGAASEMLVGISVLLTLFFTTLIETSMGFIGTAITQMYGGKLLFYIRLFLLLGLVLASYHTPTRIKLRLPFKERLSSQASVERLLGAFVGGINGFLIFGTIWFWLAQANYPWEAIIPPPLDGPKAEEIRKLMNMLPPGWLQPPAIYFAIAICLAIILVMFV